MINAFYFTLRALFVLNIFKFLSWLFWSRRKTAWIESYHFNKTSTRKQICTINILPNILRSKSNQTMKSVKHKMPWRSLRKTLFKKIRIEYISASTVGLKLYSLFLLFVQSSGLSKYQNIWKLRCWSLACISYKALIKTKKAL